ncbi:MAG: hypothetical protein FJX54_05940 [Alphaproteobacteria bacterium]|nr:hypothetical protein [Alphaproteobacteria bacterium]
MTSFKTTFAEVIGRVNKACVVPHGGSQGYGCAWGPQPGGGNRAIMSFNYLGCSGIFTFTPDPTTGSFTFTLSHIPPAGLAGAALDRHAQFLVQHASPHASLVLLVGACASGRAADGDASGSPCQEVLAAAGFPRVSNYTGPAGRACDVAVGTSTGLWIDTRGPCNLTYLGFAGGLGRATTVPASTKPTWFVNR